MCSSFIVHIPDACQICNIADVLDKKVKTLQSTSWYHKLKQFRLSSACIDQQIKTMGIIQKTSYNKSHSSISLDDAYLEHIYCETNTDNGGYKDTSISTAL
jgi:hypothetical protein